ncbi:predicted protein [Plenodomus lingam JN3]|uniref:Predicted protein n=1 Tax=Leptosphaeria maculans (strain JN3 / isolate v23.1.3 / race Av1-4-5-6-7-8) TaxID=985895 RepID=E5A170_LEPMJ|nr:predicted protein [Plenodomus lingam JN3]CBX97526.1 predicted protein [Plenodomus lingam JN3]
MTGRSQRGKIGSGFYARMPKWKKICLRSTNHVTNMPRSVEHRLATTIRLRPIPGITYIRLVPAACSHGAGTGISHDPASEEDPGTVSDSELRLCRKTVALMLNFSCKLWANSVRSLVNDIGDFADLRAHGPTTVENR